MPQEPPYPYPYPDIVLGTMDDLQPTVNFASHAEVPAAEQWGPRIIPDYQLFCLLSGEAEVRIGQEHYTLHAGDSALYGPHCPHKITVKSDAVFIGIHFAYIQESLAPVHPAYSIEACSEEELQTSVRRSYKLELYNDELLELPPFFTLPGLEPILMRIVNEYLNEQPGFRVVLRALMTELLAAIVRNQLTKRPRSLEQSKIDPALTAINKQPEKNWTVNELAALCGYHVIYFSSLFRKCTGESPKQYLISERIRKAKYYLLSGEKMEVIAERLGYASVHYFSRNFKEETGLTPTEFKQQ
ncbi:AraC family transcriptional regulator [Paenibacillus sp. OV219]|uniref:helix-turn-helix transcriptional regulator n=1 Tax=Paenibacillus sp. OV219 TaxID=1884377 RepID=UPI0008BCE48D|nr:AraC family transcriptional regulator [Paenibacillus sp. OV219]SEN84363.1 AraC-type DNA-binding protein [Paenibacillus sp. OV219]